MTRFKKGQSGNPAGRPKGTKNTSAELRKAIAAELPEILRTLVAEARTGNAQAAAVLLSRALPPLRPTTEAPEIAIAGTTLAERAEAITAAAMSGSLSPDAATQLIGVVAQQARIIETSELEERITALEKRNG